MQAAWGLGVGDLFCLRRCCRRAGLVSQGAVGSQRTSGASTRRLLTTSRLAVTLLLLLKVPLAAVLPTRSWAKSAVVALRVLAAATVTSRSRPMPPSAKEANQAQPLRSLPRWPAPRNRSEARQPALARPDPKPVVLPAAPAVPGDRRTA